MPERTHTETNFPELKKDTLRLISMKFCPYAQRTRLVLEHYNIPYETYNVNLIDKPEWFLKLNPLGLVPVLQRNDEVIIDSLICNDWLNANYPTSNGDGIGAVNQAESFRWRCLIAQVGSRVISKYYGYLFPHLRQDTEAAAKGKEVLLKGLNWLEEQLGDQTYFAGEKVGFIDYNIYPWFERMAEFETWGYPKLVAWLSRMQLLPSVKATMYDFATHYKFYQMYLKAKAEGTAMNYDFNLEE